MKGITHFLFGIAVATCFSAAVKSAIYEKSLIILLGGFFGYLADSIDFRYSRYVIGRDYEVSPGKEFDAKRVTDVIVNAIEKAYEMKSKIIVKLHTMRESAIYYRSYSVFIDPVKKEVTTKIGGLVTIGQAIARTSGLPGSVPENNKYTRSFRPNVYHTYDLETLVQIFSGPDLSFTYDRGLVRIDFIPWHRAKLSHGLFLPLILAPIFFIIFNFIGWSMELSLIGCIIIILSFWGHVIVDFTGKLGNNLAYPLTKKRIKGIELTTSGGVMGNVFTSYICITTIIWNLNAYADSPAFTMHWANIVGGNFSNPVYYAVSLLNYAIYFVVIPLSLLYVIAILYRRYYKPPAVDEYDEGIDAVGDFGTMDGML
ncbi:MAG: hypothetical protein AB1779_08875 [Candidatus Thermoplasmatota archaeon]